MVIKKRSTIPLSNEQGSKANNATIQLWKTFTCNLSSDINNKPKNKYKLWKTQAEMDIGDTIDYAVKSYQVKTTIVKCTRYEKRIEDWLLTERDVGISNVYVAQ